MTKRCSGCHEVKAAGQFSRDRSKADGLESRCRACKAAAARARRAGGRPRPKLAAVPPVADPPSDPAPPTGATATDGLERTLAVLELRPEHDASVQLARTLAAAIDGLDARERAARLPALAVQLLKVIGDLVEVARPTSTPVPTEAEREMARLRERSAERRHRMTGGEG